MIIILLLSIIFFAGILAWVVTLWNCNAGRVVCFIGLALDAILLLYVWISRYGGFNAETNIGWILEYKTVWIAPLGISFHLAMDGFSLLLAALTVLLGISSVACSWNEIDRNVGSVSGDTDAELIQGGEDNRLRTAADERVLDLQVRDRVHRLGPTDRFRKKPCRSAP